MILFNSAMGKSGSTLLCSLQEDMLALSGVRSGQSYLYDAFGGRFIQSFSLLTIVRLLYINARFGSVVVKTHAPPTPYLRLLINLGIARATCSYRDVRDVILSALDHGERNRKAGDITGVYANMYSVADAIDEVGAGSIYQIHRWKTFGKVHFVRYEDLMGKRLVELKKIDEFLGWNISEADLMAIIEKRDKGRAQSHNFNKGTTSRYKTEMTEAEISICNQRFHDFIAEMGYEL